MKWLLLFFLPLLPLSAMLVGNPSQPSLQTQGIIFSSSLCSLRVSYLDDYVYQQRYKDEFKIDRSELSRSFVKFSTFAGQATLNFKNRFDLYGIAGSSRIQVDEDVFSKRELSWGFGGKLLIFQQENFRIGADVKYFQSDQKPTFFLVEDMPFNILTPYKLRYTEIQGAIGATYRFGLFAPYLNATYLISKIDPRPLTTLVRYPEFYFPIDVTSKSALGQKRWGMALGLSLLDAWKASLSFEWRLFNQNAINLSGEIRF